MTTVCVAAAFFVATTAGFASRRSHARVFRVPAFSWDSVRSALRALRALRLLVVSRECSVTIAQLGLSWSSVLRRRALRDCACLAAIAAAALGLWPARDIRAQSKPNVLLVTLDTTRADRMGFLGSARGLTPALDAFARESIVFTNAFAQAPITTVSHATILTGTYPPFHRVTDFGAPLAAAVPYLPDVLRQAGYRTAAFVGSLVLDPRSGTAPGFDRGF